MTDELENEDSLNLNENENSENNNEDNDSSDKEGQDLEKLTEINKKLFARAKTAETELQKIRGNNNNKPKETDDDRWKDVESLKTAEKKRQFGYENSLSPEETDFVFKHNPNPSKETLKETGIKGALDALVRSARSQRNTPEPQANFSAGGKGWKEMTPEEKKANFPDYIKTKKK